MSSYRLWKECVWPWELRPGFSLYLPEKAHVSGRLNRHASGHRDHAGICANWDEAVMREAARVGVVHGGA